MSVHCNMSADRGAVSRNAVDVRRPAAANYSGFGELEQACRLSSKWHSGETGAGSCKVWTLVGIRVG